MKQKIEATLETRTSSKGSTYECVVIKLSDTSEKLVFLSPAEKELLKIHNSKVNPLGR